MYTDASNSPLTQQAGLHPGAGAYFRSAETWIGRVVPVGSVEDSDEVVRAGWIIRIRDAKDQTAFAEVFKFFAPRIKGLLMKSGATDSIAEECTQEVMATVWHKAHLYDPARASVATWIYTIARNKRIDYLRKYQRPEPEDLPWGPEAEPDQADVVAFQQESARLSLALKTLPEAQRVLIERAYYGDVSHSELAAETGLPLGTIKSRIRLALDRLRHEMKRNE